LEVPKCKTVPFADRVSDFATYRRDARGLSQATVRNQSWHVEKFLCWLSNQNRLFDNVSLGDVDGFLAAKGKTRLGPRVRGHQRQGPASFL